MCGFAGFYAPITHLPAEDAQVHLRDMAHAIRHRGPDGFDTKLEIDASGAAWAGLAHRRLAIIDLSNAGKQPMTSQCGRYMIAYNGEIYNFRALRAELEARGVRGWRGHSDTEVLLEGIAHFGVAEMLARLDGMFAFAMLDRETRHVIFARDAFGEKPLVYGLWRNTLLFASELRALDRWPGFDPEENAAARAAFMQYSCVPAPMTIFTGFYKLPPAHMVCITPEALKLGTLPSPQSWWNMAGTAIAAQQSMFDGSLTEAVEAVDTALAHSVERRMISDVPLGALLSGGIDSSLVTAIMQRNSAVPVRTFTIGMQEEGYNEAPHAEAVARHLGTAHETLMLGPADVLDIVPDVASFYDEPFADSSKIPTYLVSRLARSSVTVTLTGDGGDELFAGYDRHSLGPRLWGWLRRVPPQLRVAVAGILQAVPPNILTALVRGAGPFAPRDLAAGRAGEKLHKLARLLGVRDRAAFHDALIRTGQANGLLLSESGDGVTWNPDADSRNDHLDFAVVAMLFDTSHYMPDDVLTKVDRASMAVSLETRSPFLNRDLFSLAWRMPPEFKVQRGLGKRVLREALYRHVPSALVDRPKAGFALPVGRWLRAPLTDWAESLLSREALECTCVFDANAVRRLWEAHRSGKRDHETQLWSILMYQSWRFGRSGRSIGIKAG